MVPRRERRKLTSRSIWEIFLFLIWNFLYQIPTEYQDSLQCYRSVRRLTHDGIFDNDQSRRCWPPVKRGTRWNGPKIWDDFIFRIGKFGDGADSKANLFYFNVFFVCLFFIFLRLLIFWFPFCLWVFLWKTRRSSFVGGRDDRLDHSWLLSVRNWQTEDLFRPRRQKCWWGNRSSSSSRRHHPRWTTH